MVAENTTKYERLPRVHYIDVTLTSVQLVTRIRQLNVPHTVSGQSIAASLAQFGRAGLAWGLSLRPLCG